MKTQVLVIAALAAGLFAATPTVAQVGVGIKGDYECVAPGQHTYTFDGMVPGHDYF
ncbi:hypothetical protein [Hymenobacter elongatus]|uniref:hypothetical protein n=1 Tax=Hymenobacter elongatus TaxID=877208 RepID=UPI0014368092|nr:hypothetical protein [Hymenobacter elongatus]